MKILSQMYDWTTKPQIFLGGLTRSLTALVYTIVNKYNKYKNFISSQYSDNQAIWLEN